MLFSEPYQLPEKIEESAVGFKVLPVEPGNVIILTVSIIISALGITEFIAHEEHRSSPAHHKNRSGISYHSSPECIDARIAGLTFGTAIPAPVIIGAVGIVPVIFIIMLLVVNIHIMKRKTVMTIDEIDRCVVAPYLRDIQIRRTAYPFCRITGLTRITL